MKDIIYYPALNLAINEQDLYKPDTSCIIITGKNLNATEIRLIIDQFKKYGEFNVNIFDFIKWCRTTYKSRINLYRIRKYLVDDGYKNGISVDLADFYVNSYYSSRNILYGFTTSNGINQIIRSLQDINCSIPLSQYYKEGGNTLNAISDTLNQQ